MTKTWEDLSGGLPKMVNAIKSRVEVLSASKSLPANLTASELAEAKAGLGTLTQTWDEANEAFQGGNLTDAVTKANTVKTKAAEIMATLGMPVPAAARS